MNGYETSGDLCLSFWAVALAKGWIDFPVGADVLEIGCAEADWQTPMLALRPDLSITGLDWRPCDRPGRTVRGNVLAVETFAPASFDAIVSVSAIEHVGLGAYDDDPIDGDGDTTAMRNAQTWLKPGGWMYLDVPYRDAAYEAHRTFRAYDEAAIARRLLGAGFRVRTQARCETDHPDGPYLAMLLEKA